MTLQQRQVQSLRGPRTATLSGEDPACVCDPACCKSRPRSLKILLFSRFPHHNYVLFSFSRCFSRCSGRHTARCQREGDQVPCMPTDSDRRPSVPRWRTGSWRLAVSTMAVQTDEPANQRIPAAGPFSPSPRWERRSRDGTQTTVLFRGRTALLKSPPDPHLLMELGSVPNGTDGARTATGPCTPTGLPADGPAGEVACLSR